MEPNDRATAEECTGKDLKRYGHGLIEALPGILPGSLRETTENLSQESRCSDGESNWGLSEYKSRALSLAPPAQYEFTYDKKKL